MLKVGITGGIACGKSHTLSEFEKQGVHTIDADAIAHEAILVGQTAYREIAAVFGPGILAPDKSIDRKKLGKLVFANKRERERLNQILHPRVYEEENRMVAKFESQDHPKSPIIMVDAALMIETGSYRNYNFVIVVYCHPTIQLQRLMIRDGFSEKEALQRISSQMPLLEKIRYGDYIIENSGLLSELKDQVSYIFRELATRYEENLEQGV